MILTILIIYYVHKFKILQEKGAYDGILNFNALLNQYQKT